VSALRREFDVSDVADAREHVWAVDLINRAVEEESRSRTFKRDQIRVSSIGSCARRNVAQAIGHIDGDIPWDYSEGGHMLEAAAGRRMRACNPLVEEQVGVPTGVVGTWTHPDVYVVHLGLGVQIKSTNRHIIREWNEGRPHPVYRLPKKGQVDQALLEWFCWRQAGFCRTQDGRRINSVPTRYELLYLAREDFGHTRCSIPIEWDEARAAALYQEFLRRNEMLRWHELPEREKSAADWECGMVREHFHKRMMYQSEEQVCPMYRQCWGTAFVPKTRR
jgi:hypothetical protein